MENEGVEITENKFNESGRTVTNVGIEMPFFVFADFHDQPGNRVHTGYVHSRIDLIFVAGLHGRNNPKISEVIWRP
jgi:hypothetical protein